MKNVYIAGAGFLGANGRVGVGVTGVNGRGQDHIQGFGACEQSEVVALCDVDKQVLEARAAQVESATGKRPKTYVDMRDMFADEAVQACSFATPNHWHTLGSIWACEAGKDVYVEKPLSHNVWEGRQLVEAAKKLGRVVQHGTQRRSEEPWRRHLWQVQNGLIGNVYMARALCFKFRDTIGFAESTNPPENLDWNLWQGPAQEQQYNPNYVHYNWHWFWPYGNGDIGNQGVHQMDVALWGLGRETFPVQIDAMGGRYTYDDQGETPNTLVAKFTYDDGKVLVFEVRGRYTNDEEGARVGNLFYGSEGYSVDLNAFGSDRTPITGFQEPPEEVVKSVEHYTNFVLAVLDGNPDHVHATPMQGHLASAHCHLANISYRLGRSLTFDPKSETFPGDDEANALLTRNYREGFAVPQYS